MARIPGRGMVAVAAILAGTVGPVAAQRRQISLPDLVDRLGLTPAGAREWLGKLGFIVGDRRQKERLLLVNFAGETLLAKDGKKGHVAPTPDANAWLYREGAAIVLIHNHPAGTGLSEKDLMQLTAPGAAAVAAIGHDGSVYVAAPGPLHGGYGFGRQYHLVCAEVERRLSLYFMGPGAGLSPKVPIRIFLAHLVAAALEQASVIQYHAFLSPATLGALAPVAGDVNRAIAAGAQRLASGGRSDQPEGRRAGSFCGIDSSAFNQLFANVQSRVTVYVETPNTSAISSPLRPPKYRNSTTRALRGWTVSSAPRASSSAVRSTPRSAAASRTSSSVARGAPAPRLSASRVRAASTRTRRMTRDANAKKCVRSSHLIFRASIRRRYASLTSAVG